MRGSGQKQTSGEVVPFGAAVSWRQRFASRPCACVLVGGMLLLPVLCVAQQTPAPNAPQTTHHAQPATGRSAPAPPAPQGSSPADKPAPDAAANAPAAAKPDAAADNPFPEDVSRGAAANAAAGETPDAPAAESSSSSSSSSSSGGTGSAAGNDPNAEPDVPAQQHRRRLGKPNPKDIQSGSLAGEGRAEEDVRVGRYYLSQHNYRGAYTRFEEAARLDPASVEAIYGVAAAAEGLHKTDEAKENYKLYLQVAPDGEHAKVVEKSLKALPK